MSIPDYQTVMLPLLRYLSDGQERVLRDVVDALAQEFRLTPEERTELLPSGRAPVLNSRVGWARTYLKQAGLVDLPRRGVLRITQRGRDVLEEKPARIDVRLLERFPEFVAFRERRRDPAPASDGLGSAISSGDTDDETPEESLTLAHRRLRGILEQDIIQQVREASPPFFERLVVDLLLAMGYGGSRREAGRAIGRSGDEGIDGVINEDRLGLDVVYIQAKRWKDGNTVGRPDVQKFAGALQGQRARKGVFITASSFTRDAIDYATRIESRIVLIDGPELARLMVDHGIGVSTVGVYEMKKLDADYFSED